MAAAAAAKWYYCGTIALMALILALTGSARPPADQFQSDADAVHLITEAAGSEWVGKGGGGDHDDGYGSGSGSGYGVGWGGGDDGYGIGSGSGCAGEVGGFGGGGRSEEPGGYGGGVNGEGSGYGYGYGYGWGSGCNANPSCPGGGFDIPFPPPDAAGGSSRGGGYHCQPVYCLRRDYYNCPDDFIIMQVSHHGTAKKPAGADEPAPPPETMMSEP